MVGRDDQGPGAPQGVQRAQVEAKDTGQREDLEVTAKSVARDPAPERSPPPPRQQVGEQPRRSGPD